MADLRKATRSDVPASSLRSPVKNLDANGDGAVSAKELLAAFDEDGNGAIDGMELQKLGIQLTNQVSHSHERSNLLGRAWAAEVAVACLGCRMLFRWQP